MWTSVRYVFCPKCKGRIYVNNEGTLKCEDCGIKVKANRSFKKEDGKHYLVITCDEVEE